VAQRQASLLQRIRELKAEPPFWGYRRLGAYLHVVERRPVNKQRGWRLMRAHNLLGAPHLRRQAKRPPGTSTPQPTQPEAWWGLDRTKGLAQGVGGVAIVGGPDWYTQRLVGHYVGLQCKAPHWLAARNVAVKRQGPAGAQGKGLALMRDNGGQPPSLTFMKACRPLGLPQAFTRSNTPKGHADTERMIRTLNEAGLGLHDWTCPVSLASVLKRGIDDDNARYWQAALGYQPPQQFARDDHRSHGTQ
jgi:putative transposase